MTRVVPDRGRRSNGHLKGRITLVKGDITKQDDVEAVVSTICPDLEIGGTLNTSLIAAAGEQLDDFILEHIYKPRPGDVFSVPGFDLSAKHIIFAVLPSWRAGFDLEDRMLLRCYRGAMEEAYRLRVKKIAFPALGTGRRIVFPAKRAARLAVQAVIERLNFQIEEVRFVCKNDTIYDAFKDRLGIKD